MISHPVVSTKAYELYSTQALPLALVWLTLKCALQFAIFEYQYVCLCMSWAIKQVTKSQFRPALAWMSSIKTAVDKNRLPEEDSRLL